MSKHAFRDDLKLRPANRKRLDDINEILDEYSSEGYVLTLRQLYYQLVSRGVIPNQQKEYARLSSILVKGRMAGEVDWEAIEDRLMTPHVQHVRHLWMSIEKRQGKYPVLVRRINHGDNS